jgi:hypothetical protein
MLTKIKLQPGINRDDTSYTNSGGWFDSNYIRFRNGMPEKIGGWTKIYPNQQPLEGVCRKLYDWSDNVGTLYLACPTNIKFYVDNSSEVIDITPLRRSVTLGTDPIATVDTSGVLTITDVNHGAIIGDRVTISGAADTNGILAADLNTEHIVDGVVDADSYTITVDTAATSTGTGGGGSVLAKYQFHPGISGESVFAGWGAGPWGGVSGEFGWGFGPDTTITTYNSGLWTVDNYGEDMIACPREVTNGYKLGNSPLSATNTSNVVTVTQANHGLSNGTAVIINGVNASIGGITSTQLNGTKTISVINANAYSFTVSNAATSTETGGTNTNVFISSLIYWDVNDKDGPAISFSELGSAYAKKFLPYSAREVLISDQNRQVICLGCNPYDVTQGVDPMLVRWSDSSDPTNWDAADTTKTSGERRLSSGSYIVTAAQNREEILIWTDSSLFSMVYVGPPDGYGFTLVGTNFDVIGPNSKIVTGAVAYWMGSDNFYTYNGKVTPMPCTVRDYVFSDLSREDGDKVYCSSDSGNNEIIWFYPSESQDRPPGQRRNDRHVVYNYVEDAWYYGTMCRAAWVDRHGRENPRGICTEGFLYLQESGFDDGSTNPPTALNAYIESSPVEIEEGDNYMFIKRVIPDITFRNSTTNNGHQPIVKFTIKPQDYPGGELRAGQERNIQRNAAATLKVNRFTDQVFTRLRARSVALRVESNERGVAWRLGVPRFDMRQDGRK